MAVMNYSSSFQNSLMAAAAAAYCLKVYYYHEIHLFHPPKGAPQKRDKRRPSLAVQIVPLLRCSLGRVEKVVFYCVHLNSAPPHYYYTPAFGSQHHTCYSSIPHGIPHGCAMRCRMLPHRPVEKRRHRRCLRAESFWPVQHPSIGRRYHIRPSRRRI